MIDIVERLRHIDFTFWYAPILPHEKFERIEIGKMSRDAADEIERLREAAKDRPKDRPKDAADEIERLREALRLMPKTITDAANEIERLRGVLRQIADIEHEDIPVPQTSNEGVTWTVLAMAVGLAEKALKEGE